MQTSGTPTVPHNSTKTTQNCTLFIQQMSNCFLAAVWVITSNNKIFDFEDDDSKISVNFWIFHKSFDNAY